MNVPMNDSAVLFDGRRLWIVFISSKILEKQSTTVFQHSVSKGYHALAPMQKRNTFFNSRASIVINVFSERLAKIESLLTFDPTGLVHCCHLSQSK